MADPQKLDVWMGIKSVEDFDIAGADDAEDVAYPLDA
jgi:hypothetical protein